MGNVFQFKLIEISLGMIEFDQNTIYLGDVTEASFTLMALFPPSSPTAKRLVKAHNFSDQQWQSSVVQIFNSNALILEPGSLRDEDE